MVSRCSRTLPPPLENQRPHANRVDVEFVTPVVAALKDVPLMDIRDVSVVPTRFTAIH